MAKHNIKTKYILKQQINYRGEDEIINKPLSCTELECNEYQTDKDGAIDLEPSIPGYGNMEVLASTNRMSAITFLSLYFLRKHGTGLQC